MLAGTNTHWKNKRAKDKFRNTIPKQWTWGSVTTVETNLPWHSIYNPGGTAIITDSLIRCRKQTNRRRQSLIRKVVIYHPSRTGWKKSNPHIRLQSMFHHNRSYQNPLAINNTTQDNTWLHNPAIPLLLHVQPLQAAYGINPVSNNSAKLLARILTLYLLPSHLPAIIVYVSRVV